VFDSDLKTKLRELREHRIVLRIEREHGGDVGGDESLFDAPVYIWLFPILDAKCKICNC
jgi:hypothetical protein